MDKQNFYLNHFFIDKNNKSNTFWDKDFRKLIQNESNFILNNDNCICLYKKGKYFNKFIPRYYTVQGTYLFYGDKDLKGFKKLENVYLSTSIEKTSYPYQIELMYNHNQIILYTNSEQDFNCFKSQLEQFCILIGFHNQYSIINQIGFGSTAQVFISKSLNDNSHYAIKRIRKNSKLNPQFLMEEIQVMNDLSHPNIIKLHRVFETNRHINMVLQLVEGGELLKNQRYSIRDARIIFKQLAECVDYMHQKGVMHRDLKPSNILCKTNSLDIVLADFGLATYIKAKSHIYYRCGTTGYVAPEILQFKEGNKMYSEKCDIFSLGVILYQLVYNQHPFKDVQKEKMLKNNLYVEYKFDDTIKIPQSCKDLISLMLKQNPKQRPSAEEILKHEFFNEQFFEHQNQTLTLFEPNSDQKRSGPSLSSYNVDMKFSTLNNGFKLFEDEIDNDEEHQNADFIETSPLWSKRIELQRCQSYRSQASSIIIQRQQSQDFKTKKLSIFRSELKQQSLKVLQPQMDKSICESQDFHQIPYIFQNNMLLVHKKQYY
ncbi:unnamed protein product [Paramecium primaurelia]|uniref:Protein kinase domain-containing protein n=1 Tax=Paramecium primaurelia TaxID=5886 RepID=A0A8S1PE79_PARPR|nr:unnamed protein product [Paramecium primaurelia]